MPPHQHRVLVVEDDDEVREALGVFLEIAGHAVAGSPNGAAALEALGAATADDGPCVILLDVQMPVMDGWEFRRRQLADPAYANIPVVMFTGDNDVVRARQLGVREFLRKPADTDAILSAIERCCGRSDS